MVEGREGLEFKAWEKIPRENPFKATITEKIDGTNGCIVIESGEIVGIQSRKRFIAVGDDNHGFAAWVLANEKDLLGLGDGHHYGEWAGPGIQKNPHGLPEKTFFLFNTFRWNDQNSNRPACCSVVPVLFEGILGSDTIEHELRKLEETAVEGYRPEGVVVYYPAFRKYTKHTIKASIKDLIERFN